MNFIRHFLSLAVFAGVAVQAQAQAFNIDLDLFNSTPDVGGGAPSASFGGAANQTGFWNPYPDDYNSPYNLLGLNGQTTGVVATASGFHSSGGWNNPINTGDYALLLNDVQEVGAGIQISITGLNSGLYYVYTYAVPASGISGLTTVTIPNSLNQATQHVQGFMPGNQFILGVTHSLHEVAVGDGNMLIQLSGPSAGGQAVLNGFQIVPVPEPTTLTAFALAIGVVIIRKKHCISLSVRTCN